MPPVKVPKEPDFTTQPGRIRHLASLLFPVPGKRPNVSDLARAAGLNVEMFKSQMRRGLTQETAAKLTDYAESRGLQVTMDWILRQRGTPPRGGVNLPPGSPAAGRSQGGGTLVGPNRVREGPVRSDAEYSSAEVAGWQWGDPQIPEDELLSRMLHDRPGFVRFLQNEFGRDPRIPVAAKLARIDFYERQARESRVTVPPDFAELLEHLRGLVRTGAL